MLAIALLFVSLELFDAVLDRLDAERLSRRYLDKLRRKWLSFGLGFVVTALTASVAFSLGAVVSLYNRGYVEREDIVPYILAANVSTFIDTVIVALPLGTRTGLSVVLYLLGVTALVTAVALALYRPYFSFVDELQDRILHDRRWFAAFFVVLLVVPALLVLTQ